MIRRIFTAGLVAALSLLPLSALAADLTITVEPPNRLSWVPNEHCGINRRGSAVCWSSPADGMTITILHKGDECYVDFGQTRKIWKLHGTRGGCRARLTGNTLTVS